MKLTIGTKNSDFDITCKSMKVENGFVILIEPIWKEKITKELWIPVANIILIDIIERDEEKKEEKKE